jgi:DNA polymerase alpha subunit B
VSLIRAERADSSGDLKPATQPFRSRPQPLQLLETLNPQLSAGDGVPAGSRARVALTTTADPKDWNYRYMFEKISVRSEALDEQIDEFAEVIKEAYALADLGDPHLPSEDDIYVVGRILSPPTDTSKASATSLYLQSSRVLGGGHVVPLRFAPTGELKVRGGAPGVRGFGLFPGALVCVKGRNGGGSAFVVHEVLQPPPAAPVMTPRDELLDYQQGERLGGLPVSVHIVAGPYSLDNDLLYEPLDALIDVACDERPDVLIMVSWSMRSVS